MASKKSGLPRQVIKKILNEFDTVFTNYNEDEAEELGLEIQLEIESGEYGVFSKQIQEAIYEERLNTYERLYQIRERDPDAIRAMEILSMSLPIRKIDHERLALKYGVGNEG